MIRKTLFKAASRALVQPVYRQFRSLTIGTRTAIFDERGDVLLVRHTYAPGWLFPGGGVERGETVYDAAIREVGEECAVIAEERPLLHGIFDGSEMFPGDHVCCFVLRRFTRGTWKPNLEIKEAAFFALDALPDGATGGTRRRLAEIAGLAAISEHW
jgi:8-oxo-dGTP pyrophosphatase MutT (NUDIX family)